MPRATVDHASRMKRILPWLLAVAAYTLPPAGAWIALRQDAAGRFSERNWASGSSEAGIVLVACVAAGFLSLLATWVRGRDVNWWKPPHPARAVAPELAALVLPLVAAGALATWFFVR